MLQVPSPSNPPTYMLLEPVLLPELSIMLSVITRPEPQLGQVTDSPIDIPACAFLIVFPVMVRPLVPAELIPW